MTVPQVPLAPDFSISRIIKGGWQLAGGHGPVDVDRAVEDMIAFARAGVITFDCADIYVGVEALTGRFLAEYSNRDGAEALTPIRVLTKYVPDRDDLASLTRKDVEKAIDRSLRRLGVERLDMVQFGWWDFDIGDSLQTVAWLWDLQRAGKIEHLGVTNHDGRHLREALDAGVPLVSDQVQYSLLDRRAQGDLETLCRERGVAILCYGALAGGFLSGKWHRQAAPTPPLGNRSLTKYRLIIEEFGGWDLFQELLAALEKIAGHHGVDLAHVALRAVLDRPQVAAVIVGARRPDGLAALPRTFELTLGDDDISAIDAVLSRASGPGGPVFGLEVHQERHAAVMKYNLNKEQEE